MTIEINKEAYERARKDALRLLRFRPRSIKEMAQRLKQKGHRGFIIAEVINGLKNDNLLDDLLFSKLWIGDRLSLKPSGKALIVRELRTKGIGEKIIEEAFKEFDGAYNEYERALLLARRRSPQLKGLEDEKAKKRLLDFLNRRGFSYDTIWKVLKEIFGTGEYD